MKAERIVKDLEQAAKQLGLRVRKEKGNFKGGLCMRNGEEIVMLNRQQPPEMHLAILAEALREMPVDTVYLAPVVRDALENAWEKKALVEFEADDDE